MRSQFANYICANGPEMWNVVKKLNNLRDSTIDGSVE